MDEEYRRYKQELETLDRMLDGVWETLDVIANRMANRAQLASPNSADVTDLDQVHKNLTDRADKIIDKMQQVHKAFNASVAAGATK